MSTPVTAVVGVVLAVGGIVGLGIAYIALRHRDHPAARPLAGISGLPGLAGLCYAALVVVPDSPATEPLLLARNALLVVAVGYFLLFVLAYTGRDGWLTRWRRRAILGYAGALAAVITADLLTKRMVVETVNGLTFPFYPARSEGPLFLVTVLSVYLAIFAGTALLVRFLISDRNMYRKQTAVITAAVGVTVVGGVVYETVFQLHPGLNLNTVFYAVEAVLIALALFRYEFLNVEPLAPEVVLERINDPVLVLDDADVVVDTNPAARRLLGTADPVGRPVSGLLPGLLGAVAAGEEYVPPDQDSGATVEVYDLNAAPIRDQYDRDRGTVVVLRDISVQKQRERTLERLQSVSQRFLAAETVDEVLEVAVTAADELLEYPYSGAMVYDDDEGVLRPVAYADPLAAAFEDVPREETAVPPGETDVWQVFESGRPQLGDPLEVGGESDLPVDIGGSLLYPLGEHGILGISAGPDHEGFSDDDRRFATILASTTENALDRVEKEQQLRESRGLLATRTEQIEFFNSVLRHDLLNGMQVVQGHVDILADTVDGQASEHVTIVDDWIGDIVALTQNVRAATGAVSGGGSVELHPVDLGTALSEKVSKVREGHDAVTVDVAVDPARLPAVQADQFLPEVFENLLTNAIEHNDTDVPTITVASTVDADVVRVRVADNGPGVDDEHKEALFQKSVTSENSGSIGFGLYFVREMVDQYGGDVWFEDRADGARGAVAVVELAVARTDALDRGASVRQRQD